MSPCLKEDIEKNSTLKRRRGREEVCSFWFWKNKLNNLDNWTALITEQFSSTSAQNWLSNICQPSREPCIHRLCCF